MGKANQKTVYIRDEYMNIWGEIEKAAANNDHGIGLFLIRIWEENKKIKKEKIK